MIQMILIETHIIKKSNKYFEADHLCFLSKNLYNASNYVIRQEYFKNKTYLDYFVMTCIILILLQYASKKFADAKASKQMENMRYH